MSKPKTCGYSQTYPIGQTGQFQKIWVEYELDETDDPRQELYRCKKIVNDFFFESNKAAEKQNQEQKEAPLNKIGITIADIYSCETLKVLEESYKYLVKNKPELQAAYDQQHKKLSQ